MNNIHDMGGMHGFGPVLVETQEPVFHSEWEARTMALTLAMGAWGEWNIDRSRHARERMETRAYLSATYYERWLAGLSTLMVEHGLVSPEELADGKARGERRTPRLQAERVEKVLSQGGPTARTLTQAPQFNVGDSVRTLNINPAGHTRLPRYARGRNGTVVLHHGPHVFPDSNAKLEGENPQHLYAVRFSAAELWGSKSSPQDSVTLDLWEGYLET